MEAITLNKKDIFLDIDFVVYDGIKYPAPIELIDFYKMAIRLAVARGWLEGVRSLTNITI